MDYRNHNSNNLIPGKIFIVSAPSGAGKTTLVHAVLERLAHHHAIERVVAYTTKRPRPTEIPGKDYHFVTVEQFKALIDRGFFLEWSTFYEHYYGTPASILEQRSSGKSFILVIDRVGARQILAALQDIVTIWIYVSSIPILKERLLKRGSESETQIAHRLACAWVEIKDEEVFCLYKYHLLNDNFDEALNNLQNIFLKELLLKTTDMKIKVDVNLDRSGRDFMNNQDL
jgi:guanylate kinase